MSSKGTSRDTLVGGPVAQLLQAGLALAGNTTQTVGCIHASSEASILPAKMLSILRKARLKDKELRILML